MAVRTVLWAGILLMPRELTEDSTGETGAQDAVPIAMIA